MNSDGTGLTQLTKDPSNHGDPVWSPDGSKISFGSDSEGGRKVNIFTINADGTNRQQVTHFSFPFEAGDNSWTTDGKYIAFQWDVNAKGQSDKNARAEVWIVPTDGSREPWSTGAACASVGCAPRFKP
jgi:Tol biopolymer transport system component